MGASMRGAWMRAGLVLLLALAVLLLVRLHSAAAQAIDPHRLYEQKCASCHEPHASDLARSALVVRSGAVVGRASGRPLAQLLTGHRGTRLSEAEIKALVDHFGAMLATGWLFQEKCIACHERAVVLARTYLADKDGRIVGRYSGRDMAAFLAEHGRLSPVEAEVILAMLARQLATREDVTPGTPAPQR